MQIIKVWMRIEEIGKEKVPVNPEIAGRVKDLVETDGKNVLEEEDRGNVGPIEPAINKGPTALSLISNYSLIQQPLQP